MGKYLKLINFFKVWGKNKKAIIAHRNRFYGSRLSHRVDEDKPMHLLLLVIVLSIISQEALGTHSCVNIREKESCDTKCKINGRQS